MASSILRIIFFSTVRRSIPSTQIPMSTGFLGQRKRPAHVRLNGAPSGSATVPVDFLATQHAEQNTPYNYYSSEPSGPNLDRWYWDQVNASSAPAFLDFTTDLHHLGSGSHTATVRGLLKGFSANPNHHTKIYLNGQLIDDHSFPSGTEYTFSASVPQSYLVEGTNTLRVEWPARRGHHPGYCPG